MEWSDFAWSGEWFQVSNRANGWVPRSGPLLYRSKQQADGVTEVASDTCWCLWVNAVDEIKVKTVQQQSEPPLPASGWRTSVDRLLKFKVHLHAVGTLLLFSQQVILMANASGWLVDLLVFISMDLLPKRRRRKNKYSAVTLVEVSEPIHYKTTRICSMQR